MDSTGMECHFWTQHTWSATQWTQRAWSAAITGGYSLNSHTRSATQWTRQAWSANFLDSTYLECHCVDSTRMEILAPRLLRFTPRNLILGEGGGGSK